MRVVVIEPHALLREGLQYLLEARDDIEVVGVAATTDAGVEVLTTHRTDVTIVEPEQPGALTGPTVARLRKAAPGAQVVVLTDSDAPAALAAAVAAGAQAYLLKTVDPAGLVGAVRAVTAGETVVAPELTTHMLEHIRTGRTGPPVTDRQREVLRLVAAGHADRQIAGSLGISTRTVHKHVEHLLRRFDVHDRRDLVREARRTGVLEPVG